MFLKYVSILHHQAIDQQNLIFCQRKKNTHIFCIYLFSPYRSIHSVVLLRKGVLKIYSKCTGEHPCQSVISIKLQINFIEITLQHGCSPVNLLHIFRAPCPRNTSGWLLLYLLIGTNYIISILIKLCKEMFNLKCILLSIQHNAAFYIYGEFYKI